MKKLVIMDFDGTITKSDTFIAFLKFNTHPIKFYFLAVAAIPFVVFYYCRFINAGRLKGRLIKLFLGIKTKNELITFGHKFIEHLVNQGEIKHEFIEKIRRYKDMGSQICIVSASLNIWLKPFSQRFDLDCLCTELEFNTKDEFTGKIIGENCNGHIKKERIESYYNLSEFSTIIGYGNSKGDMEMMALANEKNWVK